MTDLGDNINNFELFHLWDGGHTFDFFKIT